MARPSNQQKPGVWSRIRTVLMVSFLAIVIWLLAESRMVQTRVVELQIVLVGNSQDPAHRYVVRPPTDESWSESIEVELEGSLASLDQATRELRGRIQMVVGDLIPSRTGLHDLDLRNILRNHQPLRSHGVTVRSLSKDFIRVEVDELLSYELPVTVQLPANVALDGPVRTIPQTVTIEGPASIISRLDGRQLIASPVRSSINALTPGRLETIPLVPVTTPIQMEETSYPGWSPAINPPRVDIRLTIRSLTQTTVIDRLPIQILLAPGEVGRWNVALEPGNEDIVSIQISGPTEILNSINDGTITPSAILTLSFTDLERGITTKQVELLGLPAGVEVISDLPIIEFTISGVPQQSTTP